MPAIEPENSNAGPCYLWQLSVVGISDDFEQLLDTPRSTIPNSARCARMELMMAVCWRTNTWRVR